MPQNSSITISMSNKCFRNLCIIKIDPWLYKRTSEGIEEEEAVDEHKAQSASNQAHLDKSVVYCFVTGPDKNENNLNCLV